MILLEQKQHDNSVENDVKNDGMANAIAKGSEADKDHNDLIACENFIENIKYF